MSSTQADLHVSDMHRTMAGGLSCCLANFTQCPQMLCQGSSTAAVHVWAEWIRVLRADVVCSEDSGVS